MRKSCWLSFYACFIYETKGKRLNPTVFNYCSADTRFPLVSFRYHPYYILSIYDNDMIYILPETRLLYNP